MYLGLADLGVLSKEPELKKMCTSALQDARKKIDDKREQKLIQAALQTINGGGKKKD